MEKGNVYIITDECFKDKLAYKIETKKLFDFINNYDKINKIKFLEPADYIFIFTEENILIIVHHEGYYTKYKWKNI
jgi:hypothetical protein